MTKTKTAGRLDHAAAAKLKLRSHSPIHSLGSQGCFRKKNLISPFFVLNHLGFCPKKVNRKGYWLLRCPFHKNGNEITPSLNLHQVDGHFRCHACGAKGKDIFAFYMRLKNIPFKTAIKELVV